MVREELEVDVLCVGAGPASLSCALHLSCLVERHNQEGKEPSLDPLILVIEKGREIGSHALSGAVVDPRGFDELLKSLESDARPPYDTPVEADAFYYLTEKGAYQTPLLPPPLRNHGNYIASLGDLVCWMAELCEERGTEVYPGFAGAGLLIEEGAVAGVRTADSGIGRDGEPKSNFQPGMDVRARITVLGEGPRGTLTGQAVRQFNLASDSQPQIYAVGVKELWKVAKGIDPGSVMHTLGYPLGGEFGGGFLYARQDRLVDVGFVVGLDYADPTTDPHFLLQQFKQHPRVASLLERGELTSYGAKAIPEGGIYAMPRLYHDGLLLVGDSAGFLNAQRLKGIHLAVKSGMLAAEAAFEALVAGDPSARVLSSYTERFRQCWAYEELWKVRNFRQSFQSGLKSGLLSAAFQFITGGRGLQDPRPIRAGHELMEPLAEEASAEAAGRTFESDLAFDKLKCLYYSDTSHEEDQPSHLKILNSRICDNECTRKYGNPCQYFCPAAVYEVRPGVKEDRIQVNFSNCVHCKTCEIMDPFQIILWTPPEGGGGPDWKKM